MKRFGALLLISLLAGCVATQEEPSAREQAAAYLKQLEKKLPPGTALQAAIDEVARDGFKCREAAARPMPMGHTVICGRSTQQTWGVVLQTGNDGKLAAVRTWEQTAAVKR